MKILNDKKINSNKGIYSLLYRNLNDKPITSIDIGFVIGEITNTNLWSKELYSKNLHAIVYEGHPFYDKDKLSIYDLKQEPLITLNENLLV